MTKIGDKVEVTRKDGSTVSGKVVGCENAWQSSYTPVNGKLYTIDLGDEWIRATPKDDGLVEV